MDANRAYLRRWLPWLDQNTKPEHTAAFIQASLRQFAARDGLACGIRVPRRAGRRRRPASHRLGEPPHQHRVLDRGDARGEGHRHPRLLRPARLRLRRARPQPRGDRLRARQHPELRHRGAPRLRARGRAAAARVAVRPLRRPRRVRDAGLGVGRPSAPEDKPRRRLRHRGRRTGGHGPGPAAGTAWCARADARDARGLRARLPRRHHPSVRDGDARPHRPGRGPAPAPPRQAARGALRHPAAHVDARCSFDAAARRASPTS